ncbi:MAG: hypothetical protein HUJ95_01910, partial [Bacteroidales bacterium]|nr:hypothetical protein [Bacteroidales bacterium]
MAETQKKKRHLPLKIFGAIIGTILGLWLIVLISIQVALKPAVLQKIINRFADKFIDGQVEFFDAKIDAFSSFPYLSLTIDSLRITYPADLFPQPQSDFRTYRAGRGEVRDTLLSLRHLSAAVDITSLRGETINVPHLTLERPKVFLHKYDTVTNLSVLKFLGKTDTTAVEEKSDSLAMPSIIVGKVELADKPRIVLTSEKDTLATSLSIGRLLVGSDFDIKALADLNFDNTLLELDTIRVMGIWGKNALAFVLDRFRFNGSEDLYDVALSARTSFYSPALGKVKVPVEIDGAVDFPEKDNFKNIKIDHLKASVLNVPLEVKGDINLSNSNGIYLNTKASVSSFKVRPLLLEMPSIFPVKPSQISPDATLGLDLSIKGNLVHKGAVPEINAAMKVENLWIDSPKDSIYLYLDSLGIAAKTRKSVDGDAMASGERIFDVQIGADTLNVNYFALAALSGKNVALQAQASTRIVSAPLNEAGVDVIPVYGKISAGHLRLKDTEGSTIMLSNTENKFSVLPKKNNAKVPVLDLRSDSKMVAVRAKQGRAFLTKLHLDATAVMSSIERNARMKAFRDSLAAKNQGLQRDSLSTRGARNRKVETVPEYMKANDIKFSFGETFKKYYSNWDLNGDISFGSFRGMTPLYPLRISASKADLV